MIQRQMGCPIIPLTQSYLPGNNSLSYVRIIRATKGSCLLNVQEGKDVKFVGSFMR